jgi:hypothetical protein
MSLLWRIYYGDNSTLDNTECDVFQLQTQDVQAIVQWDKHVGRTVLHRGNAYCWRDSEQLWYRTEDEAGFWDYLYNFRGKKYILFGRTIDTGQYKAILQAAIADKDFKE